MATQARVLLPAASASVPFRSREERARARVRESSSEMEDLKSGDRNVNVQSLEKLARTGANTNTENSVHGQPLINR